MSRKEPNPKPEGLVKPAPPPAPPRCAIFELDDETFLEGMRNVVDASQEIMDSSRCTIEARSSALNLQMAALRMKVLIMEEGFWREGR